MMDAHEPIPAENPTLESRSVYLENGMKNEQESLEQQKVQ